MNTATIHFVLGISSAGKSTFIESMIQNGSWAGLPVIMGHELESNAKPLQTDEKCIVHYNLFRPFRNNADNLSRDILNDSALHTILRHRHRIKAYLLVAPFSTLAKRTLLREGIEQHFRGTDRNYPQQQIFELLCRLNLAEFHCRWIQLLSHYDITPDIIDSESDNFFTLPTSIDMVEYLNKNTPTKYSDNEIKYIINNNKFEYQQFFLPDGSFTAGHDRSPSLALLDDDLSGKSVLDIGCAYGYFCFEAERRNAKRVVGTELKRHRYIGANILKEINGSSCQILFRDVFEEPLEEQFDIILLLNVIHHLLDPIKAIRIISKYCKERLIIEFPTLTDEIFATSINDSQVIDNNFPSIGVSLLSKCDQTFLFSQQALERVLLDHDSLFEKVEFKPSPMNKNRMVAICHKGNTTKPIAQHKPAPIKAIVLSCDKYHAVADHMMHSYKTVWPSNPFQFVVPYQQYPQQLKEKYKSKIQLVKSPPDIKQTVLTLIADLRDEEWVYWCIDDKYLDAIDEIEANKICRWIHEINDPSIEGIIFCRCSKLLDNSNLRSETIVTNKYSQLFVERKNYCQFWIHQFMRVSVLRSLFTSFPDRPFIAKEMDTFIRQSPDMSANLKEYAYDKKMLVSLENFARFGESTSGGKLLRNCYQSMKNAGILIEEPREIVEEYCFMGEMD